jgi:serine O-acetyltransferase
MNIVGMTRGDLIGYVAQQIQNFFPDGDHSPVKSAFDDNIDEALDRLHTCINSVRWWTMDEYDYLHSSQHCIFLYYLANTIWRNGGDDRVCTKLFYLNKALNGFECFYDNCLPDKFFVGHTVGIVLARTTFSNRLVLYQGCTVGKNHGEAPVLEEGVVLYPNSAVIGNCRVRAGTIIGQGVSVIDRDTPGQSYVFSNNGELVFKKPKRDVLRDIFRS